MEIINKINRSYHFCELEDGDVFMYNGTPYMKINKHHCGSSIIAVNLKDGSTVMRDSIMHDKWKLLDIRAVNASLMITSKAE